MIWVGAGIAQIYILKLLLSFLQIFSIEWNTISIYKWGEFLLFTLADYICKYNNIFL